MNDEQVETGFEGLVYKPTDEEIKGPNLITAPEFTAAVNPGTMPPAGTPAPTAAVGLTPEGREALKAIVLTQHPLPKDFGPPQMVALARDLAYDIDPIPVILARHKIDQAQFDFLREHNEFFASALAQQAKEWQGIASTQERLRAQAAAALEEQLPTLASRMGARGEKLADAIEAGKLFAKIAGVDGAPTGGVATGERFSINIDLGADQRLTISAGAPTAPGGVSDHRGEVRQVGQGQGAKVQVLGDGKGPANMQPVRQIPKGT